MAANTTGANPFDPGCKKERASWPQSNWDRRAGEKNTLTGRKPPLQLAGLLFTVRKCSVLLPSEVTPTG